MIQIKKYFNRYILRNKFLFLYQIIDRLFYFFVFVLFARFLSQDLYGQIISTFAICTVISLIFSFGLPIHIQREISKNKNNLSNVISQIIIINTYIFVFYFITCIVFTKYLYPEISTPIVIAIILNVFLFNLTSYLHSILNGLNQYKFQFTNVLIFRFITLVLVYISFILFGLSILMVFFILFIVNILYIAKQLMFIRKNYDFALQKIRLKEILITLKITLPLFLAVVFNLLYDKVDLIIISKYLTYQDVAFYNIAYGLFKSSSLAFSFILVSGYSQVSYLSSNLKAVKLFIKKNIIVILSITITLSCLIYIFSDLIMMCIYGYKYRNSIEILKILTFATIFIGLNNLTGNVLNGLKLYKENMVVTFVALFLNLLLNVLFLPCYGIIAAAYITILTELIVLLGDTLVLKLWFKKNLSFQILKQNKF